MASSTAAMPARPTETPFIFFLLLGLSSERSAEREEDRALALAGLDVERHTELDPERPERRQPAHAASDGIAQVANIDAVVVEPGVAEIEEQDATQTELLNDREDDLVLHHQLVRTADRL